MSFYGLRGITNQWFKSYLSDRKQSVCIGTKLSSQRNINYGVPQGSILGPSLFLIYINDLPNSLHFSRPTLFADDTSLFFSFNSLQDLKTKIDFDLSNINQWLCANKLTLNLAKSNFILYSLRQKHSLALSLNGEFLNQRSFVKYLGVVFDEKLSWVNHLAKISKSVSQGIGIMNKLKHIVPFSLLKNIYHSFITSHLNYCSEVWSCANKTSLRKVEVLQKKAIRILFNKNRSYPSSKIFSELNLLNLNLLLLYKKVIFFYNFFNDLCPPQYYSEFFRKSSSGYRTRHSLKNRLTVPQFTTKQGTSSLFFKGIQEWNMLSSELSLNKSLNCFKKSLKILLLKRQLTP